MKPHSMRRARTKRSARGGGSPDAAAVILDSVADGVFTVDQEWRVTSFNRAAAEITGVPRGEAVGRLEDRRGDSGLLLPSGGARGGAALGETAQEVAAA